MRDILKLVVILSLICGASASALQFVRASLTPIIEKQNDLYIRGPALESLFEKPAEELLQNKLLFSVREETYPVFFNNNGEVVSGLAVEARGKGGYGGDVVIMVGVDPSQECLIGMEIIQHSETPGVGSRIETPSFRSQWEQFPINQSLALRKDGGGIDGVSGATYSSQAVLNGTNTILDFMKVHLPAILDRIREQNMNQPSS